MTSHIDDIKGSATDSERQKLAKLLKHYFGDDLKEKLGSFEFTGVQHAQDNTKAITCHQDHYIGELSIIPIDPVDDTKSDDDVSAAENEAFNSLVGGMAWVLVSRADISPYIGFLQRLNRQPKRQHLHMLNKVLKYCKRNSACLVYKKLPGPPYILVVADSAYQSTESDPDALALRGYFIFLAFHPEGKIGGHLQLIDFISRRLQVIARSAFAAELRNLYEAVQEAINMAVWFHDIYRGPLTAQQCVATRDNATHFLNITACVDNFGLYSAITKDEPSPGSDASMLYHVKATRELLDKRSLHTIAWIDNRDMLADGLTKGKPPRDAINTALSTCHWEPQQPYKTWQSTAPLSNTTQQATHHDSNGSDGTNDNDGNDHDSGGRQGMITT